MLNNSLERSPKVYFETSRCCRRCRKLFWIFHGKLCATLPPCALKISTAFTAFHHKRCIHKWKNAPSACHPISALDSLGSIKNLSINKSHRGRSKDDFYALRGVELSGEFMQEVRKEHERFNLPWKQTNYSHDCVVESEWERARKQSWKIERCTKDDSDINQDLEPLIECLCANKKILSEGRNKTSCEGNYKPYQVKVSTQLKCCEDFKVWARRKLRKGNKTFPFLINMWGEGWNR